MKLVLLATLMTSLWAAPDTNVPWRYRLRTSLRTCGFGLIPTVRPEQVLAKAPRFRPYARYFDPFDWHRLGKREFIGVWRRPDVRVELQVVLPTPEDTLFFGFGLRLHVLVPSSSRPRMLDAFESLFGGLGPSHAARARMTMVASRAHAHHFLILDDPALRSYEPNPDVLRLTLVPEAEEPMRNLRIQPLLTLEERDLITRSFFVAVEGLLERIAD